MGRPRQYATPAERQAAYRQRMHAETVWVNRAPWARLETALAVLHDATWRAVHQGHPLAQALHRANALDTLEAAVTWIVTQLQTDARDAAEEPLTDALPKCSDPFPPKNG